MSESKLAGVRLSVVAQQLNVVLELASIPQI